MIWRPCWLSPCKAAIRICNPGPFSIPYASGRNRLTYRSSLTKVITGFRLHPGGAQAWFDVKADMATYGKVIGGGMPMGVLAGKRQYLDALDGGMWTYGDASFPEVGVTYFAGTFVRHPLAIAAAAAVLAHLKEQGPALQEQLNQRTQVLVTGLNTFFTSVGAPLRIEHCASMCLFKFQEEYDFGSLLFFFLRHRGIHILEGGSFFLTTAHTDEELERLAEAIRESVRDLLNEGFLPTVGGDGQAKVTSERELASRDESEKAIEPVPLTDAQSEVWLACQLNETASRAYNESFSLHLAGPLQQEQLTTAVNTVVARHDALHLVPSANGAVQTRYSVETPTLQVVDLSEYSEQRQVELMQELQDREGLVAFNLTSGPLFRMQLIKLRVDLYCFVFTAHHLVCDGWSADIIRNEIGQCYSNLCQGQAINLPEPVSFRRYARDWKAEWEQESRESLEFWLKHLHDPPMGLELPTDRSRLVSRTYQGSRLRRRIDAGLYRSLTELSKSQQVSMFALLLAVYNVLLARLSGQSDIIIGFLLAGQASSSSPSMVGHCANLLPLRSKCRKDVSFSEFSQEVKASVLDAYEHQYCTFGKILKHLRSSGTRLALPWSSPLQSGSKSRGWNVFRT